LPYCNGQNDFNYGKISPEDLAITSCDFEPKAEAMVLNEKCNIYFQTKFEISYYYEVHTRIKIFTEAGYKHGEVYIPYYLKSESISNVEAQVINLDGTITKLKNNNIFREKISNNYHQLKFTLPNLSPQCIIEYKYKVQSSRFLTTREWYFQKNIPVRHSKITFQTPEIFNYRSIMQNIDLIKEKDNTYEASMLNSIHHVPFLVRQKDFAAMVKFQLTAYKDENGLMKPYNSDIVKITNDLREDKNYGQKIFDEGSTSQLWKDIEPQLLLAPDEFSKAKFIYDYIQKTIRWNKEYGIYLENGGDKIAKLGTANGSELNGTIINLFRKAGLISYPLLSNPRSYGLINKGILDLDNFNHTIGYVKISGSPVFFDATEKDFPFGLLNEEDNVDEALMINEDGHDWIEIPTMKESDYYSFTTQIDDDGQIVGNLTTMSYGLSMAGEINQNETDSVGSRWVKRLERNGSKCNVSNFLTTATNFKNLDVRHKMDFNLADFINDTDELLYLPANLYSRYSENPFKHTIRLSPIEFGKTIYEMYINTINIPKGYSVESFPKNISMTIPSKGISFTVKIMQLSDKIIYNRMISINKKFMLQEEYQDVKQLFEEFLERLNDIIVFRKN